MKRIYVLTSSLLIGLASASAHAQDGQVEGGTKVIPMGPASGSSGPGGSFHYEDDAPRNTGSTPELHVVRTGDTLWDICWYYFNDPWQWPKVWSFNPQISNPHWIYPGDLVRMLPRGVFASNTGSSLDKRLDVPPDDARPAPARNFSVELRQHAFVDQESLDTSIRIDGSVDEKALLSQGDAVFLTYDGRKAPKVGDRYSVYMPGDKVNSKGKSIGSYVKILGTLEIVSVKKDKRARGVITEAFEEIERGARVGELKRKLMTTPAKAAKVDAAGNIVALVTRTDLIGQGEVVFIDLGEAAGVEVGNRMFVVRRGDALIQHMEPGSGVGQNDARFPARAIGEIVLVDVGKKVSIGLVTLAVQEMGVGDHVMMQAAK